MSKSVKLSASVAAKVAARDTAAADITSAVIAVVRHEIEGTAKIATLAAAYAAGAKLGMNDTEITELSRRAVAMGVEGCDSATAAKLCEKGAKRSKELDTALISFRKTKERALAMNATGAKSVRKAQAAKKPSGKTNQTAKPAAGHPDIPAKPVPATIKQVHVPITNKPAECRAFMLDALAMFERASQAFAKGIEGDDRAILLEAIAVLRKLKPAS